MIQTTRASLLLTFLSALTANSARLRAEEPVDYVDPLLGTSDSRWLLFPGPSMPFGMVKLSPDNQGDVPGKVHWKAGHEYTVENITGFSHIHSWTMGGLLCMPTVGRLQTRPGLESDPDQGYRSRYRHDTEEAAAGYYAVTLDDYQSPSGTDGDDTDGGPSLHIPRVRGREDPAGSGIPHRVRIQGAGRPVSQGERHGNRRILQSNAQTSWASWNDYNCSLLHPLEQAGGFPGRMDRR